MQPLSEPLRTRSRDEVLDFVYRRGTRLRRQRLVVRSAAAAVLVAVAAIPVALVVVDSGAPDRDVQMVDMPPTTIAPSPEGDASLPPDSAGTSGALGHPSASGAAATSQVAAPARPVLDPKAEVPIDNGPITVEIQECGEQEVELVTDTDKTNYLPTELVQVTATVRNTSNHPCLAPTGARLTITNYVDRVVHTDQKATRDNGNFVWQAGETIALDFGWRPCTDNPCPLSNGEYTASVSWLGPARYAPSTAGFILTVSEPSVRAAGA